MEMVMKTANTMADGKSQLSLKEKLHHLLLHRTQNILMSFHSRRSLETELDMIDPKLSNITMEMAMKIANMTEDGKSHLLFKEKLLLLPLHKTQNTPMNFHSRRSPGIESDMTDHKPSNIMTVMVMKTLNTMEDGKSQLLLRKRPLQSLLHKIQSTLTSFHSERSLEIE